MKNCKKGFVEMPIQTLNAVRKMLFSNEGGVDLTAIVNDITASDEYRDLTAINVALAYKGVEIDIDKRPRFEYDWKNRYTRYDYVGYSLILEFVKVRRTVVEVSENGEENVVSTYDHTECKDFTQWAEMEVEKSSVLAKIAERNK